MPGLVSNAAAAIQSLFGGASTSQIQQPMSPAQAANPNNRTVPPANPAPTGVAPGATNGTSVSPTGEGNGVVPATNAPPTPMAEFADLWQSPEIDPNAPKPPGELFANVTPAMLAAEAKKIDFTKAITPENLAKIQAGGDGAMQALVESLGSVAQTVYAQGAYATTKIAAKAVKDAQAQSEANLPSLIKRHSIGESLRSDNPILNNPALAPIVSALETQMTLKNPNASASDIQGRIGEYLLSLGETLRPAEKAPTRKANKSEDWDAFLDV